MSSRWMMLLSLLLPLAHAASKPAPPPPIVLPDKYTPIFYEHLQGKEKERCDKYVDELKLMEKRKQLGAVRNWDQAKMAAKQQKIEQDYDKYCLRLAK